MTPTTNTVTPARPRSMDVRRIFAPFELSETITPRDVQPRPGSVLRDTSATSIARSISVGMPKFRHSKFFVPLESMPSGTCE